MALLSVYSAWQSLYLDYKGEYGKFQYRKGVRKTKDREKMVQIYEAMVDMTLEMINKERKSSLYLGEVELGMVRTTQSLYETLNHANYPVIATAYESCIPENDRKSQYGCNYTDRPDVK